MARFSIRERLELRKGLILAPERYDPHREGLAGIGSSVALGTLALSVKKTINPNGSTIPSERFLVLDTSDAREGIIMAQKQPVLRSEIGSTKKLVPPRSVIISRLRPYLRQVAFVDEGIDGLANAVGLACSTEFYILSARDERSLAFLVPLLLSEQVQQVLAASQEGGHHPRFGQETLLGLPVPQAILDRRDDICAEVERAIACFRESRSILARLVSGVQDNIE